MASKGNPLGEERRDIRYIRDVLWPEFLAQFITDNAEYPEERPLGVRAEWHGLHRKVGKLQAPVWDGESWDGRESVRRMFQEIVGHAFLALASLDYAGENCSTECEESHTYGVGCSLGRMLRKPDADAPPARVFDIRPGKLVPVDEEMTKPLTGWGGGHSRVPVRPAPADEGEAYDAQRKLRRQRQTEGRTPHPDREAAAWRVRHCGPGCAYGHRYSGECQNAE